MPGNRPFWRNVAIIGVAHVVAVIGVVRWNAGKQANPQNIVWVNGDLTDGDASSAQQPVHARPTTPTPNHAEAEPPAEKPEEDPIVLASAKSEIQLPAATATATPTPRPAVTAKPSVSPLVKTQPKPSQRPPRKPRPKPTPRPTPKPTPKPRAVLAKASPKPIASVKPDSDDADEETDADTQKKHTADVPAENDNDETRDEKPVEHGAGTGTASGAGSGHARGLGKNSQFASYGRMLHDRFYSEWDQPTSSVASASKISTMVRVRIEKDGRVSAFEILRPSGNVLIDDSVAAIGKRVPRVDPLPAGLITGGHYDVKINFELNPD